jgi:FlaA1/EpsC-like NDP-sugar epimerase
VRFGNVLGSTGSVVPLFQRQIARGGPITVTDAAITRYFMTTREAVELVLQASALDARAALYVLDMGTPVKIVDLARQMIQLAGKRPDRDIAIEVTGLRPGEKLHEELFHAEEAPAPTTVEGVMIARPRAAHADLGMLLDQLERAARAGRRSEVLALIRSVVPEYARAVASAAE